MSAAHAALRGAHARGHALDLVVLERTGHTSYSACGIPYWISGDVAAADDLVARTYQQHRDLGVDLRLGTRATAVDLDRRTVTAIDDTETSTMLEFDELVFATGAAPIVPDWARTDTGALISGVHPVKNLDDGAVWLDLLAPHRNVRDAVIVGGGYIGVEMAETLLRRDVRTTLLTHGTVLGNLEPVLSDRVAAGLRAAGIDLRSHTEVAGVQVDSTGRVRAVTTATGDELPADAVVLAVGVRPATELGAAVGLPLGSDGGYLPDPTGRLAPGVWAAGDCCECRHRITGAVLFAPLGTHANKQGRVVGDNIAGGRAEFAGVLGSSITRFVADGVHLEISRTGLSTAEAAAAGIDYADLLTESDTASGYMPEADPIAVQVVAGTADRRLLGMQIVGGRGAGKRIDTAAAAIWGGLTVDDLAAMDLAYSPPFATVWDAVQIAARRLADRL
ncbi:FAD-dependent oxidoreductase [Skermania piniformis]|uniref:FAD-dependent oxidoreductase n=2 Tax=Skermania pinensis TaxID=39122 RepID=A0ABX8SCQ8_9ACTN|nr:FAD-dependent oxidoreductase [Skermania piniformis]